MTTAQAYDAWGLPLAPAAPVKPVHACAICEAPHACFGVGPPLLNPMAWFCHACWQSLPTTQASIARRTREALEGDTE